MRRAIGSFGTLAVCAAFAAGFGVLPVSADVLPYGMKIEKVLDNSVELGDLEQSPTGELWLLEKTTGTIRVLEGGVEAASLTLSVSTACESGLLDVAFDPAHGATGLALVSYVDGSGRLRVDEVFRNKTGLSQGAMILDLGLVGAGCRPGGGLTIGADGKLFVAVGDLGNGADAQDDAKLAGKVLRAELDGSVPADNPDPASLVWAKGFRHGADLALNPGTARPEGTLYLADVGASGSVHDEFNDARATGNYGWPTYDGQVSQSSYIDPLEAFLGPTVNPEGIATLTAGLGRSDHAGAVVYACTDADDVREAFLTGPGMDQLDVARTFYDPDGDRDGTPDALCPDGVHAVAEGGDGWLYAANNGSNPGVWRVWRDTAGPREVSAPGSPFPLTVEKNGGDLVIGWEQLGDLDIGRPGRNGGQHPENYQVWQGSLPLAGTYSHTAVLNTDGLPAGQARREATLTPGGGNQYYLVSAQGDNMDGSLGVASTGDDRPGPVDYCDSVGFGIQVGDCAPEFFDHDNPGQPLKLIDYNHRSPTHMQALSMSDFRGKVIHMDLSADNCFFCNAQVDLGNYHGLDLEYRDRDFVFVTIMLKNYSGLQPLANPTECAAYIEAWANDHEEDSPILCDVDKNGDNRGDVVMQYWHGPDCGGTPQNFYIDQANVIYEFKCGGDTSVEGDISGEVNAETCE